MSPTKTLNPHGSPNVKIGIVINSRLASSRIPNKAILKINGIPLIEHLVNRLQTTKLSIIIAVPYEDKFAYNFLSSKENVFIESSIHDKDPLARMHEMCELFKLDYVIRITHDKIFIDTDLLLDLINTYVLKAQNPKDYVYLSNAIPGTGFEIISKESLTLAKEKFAGIEFIGYAIREVTTNQICVNVDHAYHKSIRLLIDYPNDLNLMNVILSQLGNNCSLDSVCSYLIKDIGIRLINRLPKVTVYTCAYNSEAFIDRCIRSVLIQRLVNFEYILIDDYSSDKTPEIMAKYTTIDSRLRFVRNEKNLGLASSCNVALEKSMGEYIIRMDSDDWFKDDESLLKLLIHAEQHKYEATYPDYEKHDGENTLSYHSGNEEHHAGVALFDRSALNYIRFTDGLRGHDSLDIWTRARGLLRIGYFKDIVFCYRQRNGSLSKIDLKDREIIKDKILGEAHAKRTVNRSNEIIQSGIV